MKSRIKGILIFIILVVIDQVTKYLAITKLAGNGAISLIPNVLELLYVENRGAAFGILQNKQWFFVVITIVVLVGIFWVEWRIPQTEHYKPLHIVFIVLAAGACGNLIDRILRHYVVDFIYFKPIDFPVFNVADIYVTLTAITLVLLFLFVYREEDLDQIL